MSASEHDRRVPMMSDRTAARRGALMARWRGIATLACAVNVLACPAAFAQAMPAAQDLIGWPVDSASAAPARRLVLGDGAPLSAQALSARRGGEAGGSVVQFNGSVSDNRAVNVATGSNTIGSGALAGASGVPVVIQNSGNNVLIQSATIVNVVIK